MKRQFHCVMMFDQVVGDFLMEGIFSKAEEANALARELNPAWARTESSPAGNGPYVIEYNYRQIRHHFARESFDKLFDPLMKIAGLPSEFPVDEDKAKA